MEQSYEIYNKNVLNDTVTLLKRWLENRNNNKTFADYLEECGYMSVIIMDAGEIGRLLYDEIKGTDIKVICFYDRNAEGINNIDGIAVKPFSEVDQMPEADIVLVSTIYNYQDILKMLVGIDPNIRSLYLRDAVYEF